MNNDYKMFVKQCIKNRIYLDFSPKDMENCLIDVSQKQYEDFEKGKYFMSKENIIRLTRVLCIEKPVTQNIDKFIDINGLNDEELTDLSKVLSGIVGDDNA